MLFTGQSPSALASKIYQRLSVALQRALSQRECAYIDKQLRGSARHPAIHHLAVRSILWDVQLSGTRLPTWAF
jgi:hypothetical protein